MLVVCYDEDTSVGRREQNEQADDDDDDYERTKKYDKVPINQINTKHTSKSFG